MKRDRGPREPLLEEHDVARAKSLYESGLSIRAVAERMGIGKTLAYEVLSGLTYDGKGKVKMRTKGGNERGAA